MDWQGTEKRRFVRADFSCKIIVCAPQEKVISAHTENIGAGGIRVILNEDLGLSSIVGLEIYLNSESIVCKGRIVWAVEKKEPAGELNKYDIGIEFYEINAEDRETVKNFVEARC